jgi:hypothetical protein
MNAPSPAAPGVDDPAEKPYPGYARELAAMQDKIRKANAAHDNPLPGPLLEAFAGEPVRLHGFTLQPVTMGLVALLKRLQSPLLAVVQVMREELTREDGADESTPELAARTREARLAAANIRIAALSADDEALVETIFAFVHPVDRVRSLLNAGRDKFREAALAEIADKLHPLQVMELQQAVAAHYAGSFATAVQYEARQEKADGTVFTPPPAGPTTVSAGGSPSLAT